MYLICNDKVINNFYDFNWCVQFNTHKLGNMNLYRVYYDKNGYYVKYKQFNKNSSSYGKCNFYYCRCVPKKNIERYIWIMLLRNNFMVKDIIDNQYHMFTTIDRTSLKHFITSDKYDICDIKTFKKFKIPITLDYINVLCAFGKTDILDIDYVKNYLLNLKYSDSSELPMDIASMYGSVKVLQWWIDNNIPIKYSETALHHATFNNHVDVLEWWFKSNLPLKYDINLFNLHRWSSDDLGHRYIVVDWWLKSGLRMNYGGFIIAHACREGDINRLNYYKNNASIKTYNDPLLDSIELKYTLKGIMINNTSALDWASEMGYVNILEWWKNLKIQLQYSEYALDHASVNRHFDVLEWWLKSKLPLKYSEYALDQASENGHVDVIDWWLKSNLPLKNSKDAINMASKNGHIDVLNKLFDESQNKSKYFGVYAILKYDTQALDFASENGHLKILEWWGNSNLHFKYSVLAMDSASKNGHVDVLNWWKNWSEKSKKKLKYSDMAINYASINGHINVLEWWKNSELNLKYCKKALHDCNNVDVLEWWKNSKLQLRYNTHRILYDRTVDALKWWKNSGLDY